VRGAGNLPHPQPFVVGPAGVVIAEQMTVDQIGFGDDRKHRDPQVVGKRRRTRLFEGASAPERGRGTEPRVHEEAIEDRGIAIDGVHLVYVCGQKHRRLRLSHRKNRFRLQAVDGTVADQATHLGVDVIGVLIARMDELRIAFGILHFQ
jgi:hypothetical protein